MSKFYGTYYLDEETNINEWLNYPSKCRIKAGGSFECQVRMSEKENYLEQLIVIYPVSILFFELKDKKNEICQLVSWFTLSSLKIILRSKLNSKKIILIWDLENISFHQEIYMDNPKDFADLLVDLLKKIGISQKIEINERSEKVINPRRKSIEELEEKIVYYESVATKSKDVIQELLQLYRSVFILIRLLNCIQQ